MNEEKKTPRQIIKEKVYDKYHGHCAYCGELISIKNMHIDHLLSQYNFTHHIKNNWRIPNHLSHLTIDDLNHIDNLMPACASCNLYKSTDDLEGFRKNIADQPRKLRAASPMLRLAERFNIVSIIDEPDIVFYFEKND